MRIAICVSGLLRDHKKSFDNLKETIIEPIKEFGNDVDLFIHSWQSEEEMKDDKWGINAERSVSKVKLKSFLKKTTQTLDDMDMRNKYTKTKLNYISSNIYPITDYKLEKQSVVIKEIEDIRDKLIKNAYNNAGSPFNLSCWLYSLYKSNELKNLYKKEHDVEYDLVIRWRTELEFTSKLTEVKFQEILDSGSEISIPLKGDYKKNGINDTFAIGTEEALDWYCDIKNHVDKYIARWRKSLNPHTLFGTHLSGGAIHDRFKGSFKSKNLKPHRFIFEYTLRGHSPS